MINKIGKQCAREYITYTRIDQESVHKSYYINGQIVKERDINVRKVRQNRRSHRNTDDFFSDMIWNYGYSEVR